MKWLLGLLLIIGCAPNGPKVNLCIVDAANHGFQCEDANNVATFVLFEYGTELMCASPQDTELFLKACKNHQILDVTLCSFSNEGVSEFHCTPPVGKHFALTPQQADNYACLSPQDRTRLLQRCK